MINLFSKLFSEPSIIISVCALAISILNYRLNEKNSKEQNRRWELINLGYVELDTVGFFMYKEFKNDEATRLNWGHKARLYRHTEDGVLTDRCRIPYELIFLDPTTGQRVSESNSFFTVDEAEAEIARLRIWAKKLAPIGLFLSIIKLDLFLKTLVPLW